MIRNTDQCLAQSSALAAKESEERYLKMASEIERLLNDHDDTCAHTMISLEKRLDAKSDLMMRKLDEISNGRNREKRPFPGRTLARQLLEREPKVIPRPSRGQDQILILITGREPGQPRRGRVGRTQSHRRRMLLRRHG